jgi:signal transduction histidine kinase
VVSRGDEVLGMVRDITHRKRLEREILEISGREQRRIGQDLHDSLCQHLAGIGFLSKALEMQIRGGGKAKPGDAADIVSLVDQAITLTRGFARGLNPVRLEEEGLMNGLLELAANTERLFGIKCRVEFKEPILLRDDGAALHLYRIVQEALSNAIKHGKAEKVIIGFRREGSLSILTVKDDGVGFVKTANHGGGIGLNIMNYRASMIGASLGIGDSPDGGALLVCSFQAGSDAKEGV